MIKIKDVLVQDQTWHLITIEQGDFQVTLLDYGAAIYSIQTPDKNGVCEEVLLQYKNLADYKENSRHLNATIGPTAGRIANATFQIDETTYYIDKNHHQKHNLHGGREALSYTLFDFSVLQENNRTEVTFTTYKRAQTQGYPGSQKYAIIYTILPYEVRMEFVVETDESTLVNLTNHAYFNLSGNLRNNVLSHHMRIDADRKLTLDDEQIPVGIEAVLNTPYDFQEERPIQQGPFVEIDDPYLLTEVDSELAQATLYEPLSGRQLDVFTTYPSIVCYTDNFPMPYELAFDAENKPYMGVCFEAQNPPNGIHLEGVESSILRPNQSYYHQTRFLFTIRG